MPRTRPHFKVHLSLAYHPRTAAIYNNVTLLGLYVRIGMMADERYASKTADSFILSEADLCRLTDVRDAFGAIEEVRRLESVIHLADTETPGVYRISFRNLSKKQGFKTGDVFDPETGDFLGPAGTETSDSYS